MSSSIKTEVENNNCTDERSALDPSSSSVSTRPRRTKRALQGKKTEVAAKLFETDFEIDEIENKSYVPPGPKSAKKRNKTASQSRGRKAAKGNNRSHSEISPEVDGKDDNVILLPEIPPPNKKAKEEGDDEDATFLPPVPPSGELGVATKSQVEEGVGEKNDEDVAQPSNEEPSVKKAITGKTSRGKKGARRGSARGGFRGWVYMGEPSPPPRSKTVIASKKGKPRGGRSSTAGPFGSLTAKAKFLKKLSGMDKQGLLRIVKGLVEDGHLSIEQVKNYMRSSVDAGDLVVELTKAKDAVFKALPQPWKYSCSPSYRRNDFAYKRCAPALDAFKSLVKTQAMDLRNLDEVDVVVDYVLKAWPVVGALPQWIGCGRVEPMKFCLDTLAGLLFDFVTKGIFSNDKIHQMLEAFAQIATFEGEMDVEVSNAKMTAVLNYLKGRLTSLHIL